MGSEFVLNEVLWEFLHQFLVLVRLHEVFSEYSVQYLLRFYVELSGLYIVVLISQVNLPMILILFWNQVRFLQFVFEKRFGLGDTRDMNVIFCE